MAKTFTEKVKRTHAAKDGDAAWMATLCNHPVLSHEETMELITRSQSGCLNSRNRLVRHNMRLIVSIANRFPQHNTHIGDLINVGALGLIRCIEKFDVSLGFSFSTYGTLWIRQAMGRMIADKARVVRLPVHFYELMNKVNRIKGRILTRTGNDNPTPEEILEALGSEVTQASVKNVMRVLTNVAGTPVSLNQEIKLDPGGGDGITIQDTLPCPNATPEEVEQRRDCINTMRKALGTLTERQLAVITGRVMDERTLEEIGDDPEFGVTRERIRQIEAKALKKLRRVLEQEREQE